MSTPVRRPSASIADRLVGHLSTRHLVEVLPDDVVAEGLLVRRIATLARALPTCAIEWLAGEGESDELPDCIVRALRLLDWQGTGIEDAPADAPSDAPAGEPAADVAAQPDEWEPEAEPAPPPPAAKPKRSRGAAPIPVTDDDLRVVFNTLTDRKGGAVDLAAQALDPVVVRSGLVVAKVKRCLEILCLNGRAFTDGSTWWRDSGPETEIDVEDEDDVEPTRAPLLTETDAVMTVMEGSGGCMLTTAIVAGRAKVEEAIAHAVLAQAENDGDVLLRGAHWKAVAP